MGIPVSNSVSIRNQFGRFVSELDEGVEDTLEELRDFFEAVARNEAPIRTGRLRASTRGIRVGNQVRVSSNTIYAQHVQDGIPGIEPTRPHGYLANKSEGFLVKGPVGARPANPYLLRAYQIVWPRAIEILDKNVN